MGSYLLTAFTVFEAHSIATVTTVYDPITVLQAVIITFSLFVGLTLFTFQTKYDFSGWQPFLYGSLWVRLYSFGSSFTCNSKLTND